MEVEVDTRTDDGKEQSKPLIKYHYTYFGTLYRGNKVKYGNLWSAQYEYASGMLSGIVKGSEVII